MTKREKRPSRIGFLLVSLGLCCLLLINVVAGYFVYYLYPYTETIDTILADRPSGEDTIQARKESEKVTQKIEEEGIILLENKNNSLPLEQEKKINVFGYGARDFVYGGSGSGSGDSSNNVTFWQGLEQAGFELNMELAEFYDEAFEERAAVGFTGNDFTINEPAFQAYPKELLEQAEHFSDIAVVVVSRLGGEGADLPMDMAEIKGGDAGKHYLELQQSELDLLDYVKNNYETVVVMINSANTMELGFLEDEKIDAALWVGCAGSTGANAIGDVLAGKVNPSGRTTDTYAYEVESAPSYACFGDYDYTNVNFQNDSFVVLGEVEDAYHYVDYLEGIYVGYRFYETRWIDNLTGICDEESYQGMVQYPFGYGLSYTDFKQEIIDFHDDKATVTVRVKVTNVGNTAGKDVVQIYHTPPYTVGGIEKSHVVLTGFGKTEVLEPGASQELNITFSYEDMASYDYESLKTTNGGYVLERGEYQIKLMRNAHEVIESRTIEIEEDVIFDEEHDGKRSSDNIAAVNQFENVSFGETLTYVSRADWEGTLPEITDICTREASKDIIAGLTEDEYPTIDGEEIVVREHGLTLADMKGLDYDDPLWEKLLEQLTLDEMYDYISNAGWGTSKLESVEKPIMTDTDGPNGVNHLMTGSTGNQFTGQSVLGCTWNTELAYEMGASLAKEAGVQGHAGLYAPGINIHRSPFGGRNFEYFSEDGYHSGIMAAAEIQGMSSEGVYCFAKHFAVNEQEMNRDEGGLIVWVNEQALREIYAKGFELAVKEGKTAGIMASYSRMGTTNSTESYELLTTVLREEWGFVGAVITDSVMQNTFISADRALLAGCDLQLGKVAQNELTKLTTQSVTGHHAMRKAMHNALYVVANSNALETAIEIRPQYLLYVGVIAVDVALFVLCFVYYVKRHRKMKRWKHGREKVV